MLLRIPTQPHVHKYVCRQLAGSERVSRRDSVGRIVLALLASNHYQENQWYMKVNLNCYTCETNLIVSVDQMVFALARTWSEWCTVQFNLMVDDLVKAEMCAYVDAKVGSGMMIKDALHCFVTRMGFSPDEYKFDSAKKAYYRYRNPNAA